MSRTTKRPYRRSRAFDSSCRCHGACSWCRENRLYATIWRQVAAEYAEQEFVSLRAYLEPHEALS
jgi:hypothetical protein